MNMPSSQYESAANELRDRVLALIPGNPQILTMTSAWDLFKVSGFKCGDLEPALAQAGWALANAKHQWKEAKERGTTS